MTKKTDWTSVRDMAVQFSKRWDGRHREESEDQNFIRHFLRVFGISDEETETHGVFQHRVTKQDGSVGKIDFYWKDLIAIEMKSTWVDLNSGYSQLLDYMGSLPEGEKPPDLWVISNFANFRVIRRGGAVDFPFKTANLKKHVRHFAALAGHDPEPIRTDKESVNVDAAERLARLHEALKGKRRAYPKERLQIYVARLLFCLFADDTGVFDPDFFGAYVRSSNASGIHLASMLDRVFRDLNRPVEEREDNAYLSAIVGKTDGVNSRGFRYVNGGLFADAFEPPDFDKEARSILLDCLDFDWSGISPAIFGSMFQTVMDDGERREFGAHYTSEENILKLINPLFMDALKAEFRQARNSDGRSLAKFHDKLAGLRFLDPACGSGNFLIIAYRELRRLEHDVIEEAMRRETGRHRQLNLGMRVRVKVEQFSGIEVKPWACQLAKTGMWLMDHLMNNEASDRFGDAYSRFPLEEGTNIVQGNALAIDWESVVPSGDLDFILGNPPYAGYSEQTKEQKRDVKSVCTDKKDLPLKSAGRMDYVAAWYFKAARIMKGTRIRAAFVSTNSISQGEQPAYIWKPLQAMFGLHIDFAHRAFRWDSEAKGRAAVHCVIIGFSAGSGGPRTIYDGGTVRPASNISPYLVDAPTIYIESRNEPICPAPRMISGNRPADGGCLIIADADLAQFIQDDPLSEKYIKRLIGSEDYIHGTKRWCLWLVGMEPDELARMPRVRERVRACRNDRLNAKDKDRQKLADTPALFREQRNPDNYLLVPRHSSEGRRYIPMGFLGKDSIPHDSTVLIADATLYHFGILTSSVHMAWARAVCGRLEMRYRYSKKIVYNNFPWPKGPTDAQMKEVEALAQGVLDARLGHPASTLADMYDPAGTPPDLAKAHRRLDAAVKSIYGLRPDLAEPQTLAELMEMHVPLAAAANAKPGKAQNRLGGRAICSRASIPMTQVLK